MFFFDAHIHCSGKEKGGFLIGLEGKPLYPNSFTNTDILSRHRPASYRFGFYYVQKESCLNCQPHPFLKYHPRREQYTPEMVIQSIKNNSVKCVIIDTLNEPYWQAYDYWEVARSLPDIPFVFAHCGGYLVNDFIKICHFQKNVYIDFSLTHTLLGHYGHRPQGLPYIHDAITYSLHSDFKEKIFLASDAPFYKQDDVVEYYDLLNAIDLLNDNFLRFAEKLTER